MLRIKYQLKNIRRDKFCIMTFLLPILIGIVINLLPAVSVQTLGELSFGVMQNDLSEDVVTWLQKIGSLTEYRTLEELEAAVNNPSTQMVGVLRSGNSIRTILSGDEFELYETIGKTLAQLYNNRNDNISYIETVVSASTNYDGLKSLLIVITLVTAMFMGCTFNAMNIISEKEDGIALINQILPMNTQTYLVERLVLGFIGGTVSTLITIYLCMQISIDQIIPLFILIVLSAYIASLVGLFIGYFSSGLMIGIVYIKIVMIMFLAPPILFYLTIPRDSIVYLCSYLFPSSASFYGLMDILNRQAERIWFYLVILSIHAVVWSSLYFLILKRNKSNSINIR